MLCDMCEGEGVTEREEVFRAMLERVGQSGKEGLVLGLAGWAAFPISSTQWPLSSASFKSTTLSS